MKKKFSILKVIGLFLLILAVFVTGSLFINLYSYLESTPRITPYENITINTGKEIYPEDIALIEKSHGTIIKRVCWENGSIQGITVKDDGSSFVVTEGEGILEVYIFAQKGESGEDAYETIEITVQ